MTTALGKFTALVANIIISFFPALVGLPLTPTQTVPMKADYSPAGSGGITSGVMPALLTIETWRVAGIALMVFLTALLVGLWAFSLRCATASPVSSLELEMEHLTGELAACRAALKESNMRAGHAEATRQAAEKQQEEKQQQLQIEIAGLLDDKNKRAGHAEAAMQAAEQRHDEVRQHLQGEVAVLQAQCAELQRANAALEARAAAEARTSRTGLVKIDQRIRRESQPQTLTTDRPQPHDGHEDAGDASVAAKSASDCVLGVVESESDGQLTDDLTAADGLATITNRPTSKYAGMSDSQRRRLQRKANAQARRSK